MRGYLSRVPLTCAVCVMLGARGLHGQGSALLETPKGPSHALRVAKGSPFARADVAQLTSGTDLRVMFYAVDTSSAGRHRRAWVAGAIIGGVVGAVSGAVAGADFARSTCERPNCSVDSDAGRAAVGGAVIGAAVGAGLGTVIGVIVDRRRAVNGSRAFRLHVGRQ
jgi:hypothetical protein